MSARAAARVSDSASKVGDHFGFESGSLTRDGTGASPSGGGSGGGEFTVENLIIFNMFIARSRQSEMDLI